MPLHFGITASDCKEGNSNMSPGQIKPRKRHCMVVYAYYPLAETRVQREAEALLGRDYEVDVICLRLPTEVNYEVVRGVNVYRLPVQRGGWQGFAARLKEYTLFFILATFKLAWLHQQKQYDVVQVHNLPDFLVFSALWPKLKNTRVILDIHDVTPEFYSSRSGRSLQDWRAQPVIWQEQLACRFADSVITVTEPWRQALIQRGVPANKTSVVMNVPDDRLFHRNISCQTAGQNDDNTFCLIYHGVQSYRHGLDILLHAIHRVRSQIPGLQLILHGNGDAHKDLVNLANELQLTDCVHFSTKFVPVSQLPGLVFSADVGVVPYRRDIFTDGILPTKLMEYIALGMPAITSRTPVIETYFDETMVCFFEPDNIDELASSILTLYRNPARREALVQGSAQFMQKYSWSTQADNYVHLVDQLGAY